MEIKNVVNLQTSMKMVESQSITQQSLKTQAQTLEGNQSKVEDKKHLSPQELEKLVKDLREKISILNTQLKIEMEKVSDNEEIPVVKVIDKNTNKVIRQIPPEYMIKIAKYIDEITGLLFREKA